MQTSSTSSYVRSSKKTICPICRNTHGCKIISTGLVECLRVSSKIDTPKGFRFIKELNAGMGGLFSVDTFESRERQTLLKMQKALSLKTYSPDKVCLSVDKRDSEYRKILDQLYLCSEDKIDLENRGVLYYEHLKTWFPNKKVSGISKYLPGASETGCLRGFPGLFIPALDPHGRICGGQIKVLKSVIRKYPEHGIGKYVWLSSTNGGGSSPNLPNGELPLFFFGDNKPKQDLWLCEGSLKPMIASQYLKQNFIGASGGHFSPNTFLDYLRMLDPGKIIFAPDAGCLENPHVAAANWRTLSFLKQKGYEPQIAWWGQRRKNSESFESDSECSTQDIDELVASHNEKAIQYIDMKSFLEMHPVEIRNRVLQQQQFMSGVLR